MFSNKKLLLSLMLVSVFFAGYGTRLVVERNTKAARLADLRKKADQIWEEVALSADEETSADQENAPAAELISAAKDDEKAMSINDEWLLSDTENTVKDVLKKMEVHKGFQKYLARLGHEPRMFIAEVQNETSEAYFPIDDLNDAILNEFSASGDFKLIDAKVRNGILKGIQYRNDGMVAPSDIKKIGKQTGAELLMSGVVRMNPKVMRGKTIKEYTVNLYLTDVETGEEVGRVRSQTSKFSKHNDIKW